MADTMQGLRRTCLCGEVTLETDKLSSVTYRGGATLKGLFS